MHPQKTILVSAALSVFFAFMTFLCTFALAQTHETNSYPNGPSSELEPLLRNSFSGASFQSTLDFFKRKDEEAEAERAERDRQLRIFGNNGNIPEKIRDTYFGQLYSTPYYQR